MKSTVLNLFFFYFQHACSSIVVKLLYDLFLVSSWYQRWTWHGRTRKELLNTAFKW